MRFIGRDLREPRVSMEERWQAGVKRHRRTLRHELWLSPSEDLAGVRILDITATSIDPPACRWDNDSTMNIRTQISMDPALRRRARAKAAALGISLSEYVRRLVAQDLGESEARGFAETGTEPKFDISSIFDLGSSAKPTDIARDKDKLVGEAVWADYLRKVGRAAAT